MNYTDRTTLTSRRFKSFLIRDILEISNERMSKDKNDDVRNGIIQDSKAREKTKLCFANQKTESKKRATSRSPFQDKQRQILEKHFEKSKYLTQRERAKIADETSLTSRQVKTWFQNRRTRWRKVNGNKELAKRESSKDYKKQVDPGDILSNFSEKLSVDCVSQLHKQLSGK